MRILIAGLLVVITRAISDWDICRQYQLTFSLSTSSRVSSCDDAGFCSNSSSEMLCDEAFERLIDAQELIIDIPPIVSQTDPDEYSTVALSNRMYHELMMQDMDPEYFPFAQPPPRDDVDESMNAPEYVSFERITSQIVETVMDRFPYLVYNETHDGVLLREFIHSVRQIAWISITHAPAIVFAVHQSDSMRKFAWSVRAMVDHVAMSSTTFKETERLLVSIAPWMHAFLHAFFILQIHFPGLIEDNHSQDVIYALVKYHPLYTNDDGVWYIRTTPPWNSGDPPRIPLVIDRPDGEFWGDRIPSETALASLLPSSDLSSLYAYDTIRGSFLTWKSFHDSTGWPSIHLVPSQIEIFNDYVETNYLAALHGRLAIAEMFSSIISPKNILSVISPYSTANAYMEMRLGNHRRVVTINRSNMSMSTIYVVSQYSKYDLAGRIEFGFVDESDVRETPKPYPGGMERFYEDLMEEIFDITSGYFELVGEDGSYRRTTTSGPLGVFLSPRQVSVAIGRIIGLILLDDNPGNILTRFLTVRPNSSIIDCFFFESYHIRAGFYDVYHSNMLERMFHNNGTRLLEALVH